MKDLRKVEYR